MSFLRVFLWSACCVAAGIALATVEVSGHTPWEHARRAVGTVPAPKLDSLKEGAQDAMDAAKKKLSVKDEAPTERHSDADREAVNQILARRTKK